MEKIKIFINDWTEMGLIIDGKPISKTAFKKRLDCHKYGYGKNSFYAGYIYKDHPKKLCYQFNTYYCEPKKDFINTAYNNFLSVINGNVEPIKHKLIVRGNSGLPIGFHLIYWI